MIRRVAVIGLGTFGQEMARQLSRLKCEVIAIDIQKSLVEDLADEVSRAAVADVRDRDAMRELGVGDCDAAILSLRGHIDTSVLAILVLQELGVENIIAQAISEDHRRVLLRLGATRVVFPDKDMAERTAQMIVTPDLLDYVTLAPGYGVSEIEAPAAFLGKTIVQVNVRQEFGVNVAAVRNRLRKVTGVDGARRPMTTKEARDGRIVSSDGDGGQTAGRPFVPTPTYVFKEGDILICLGLTGDLRRLADVAGGKS